MSVTSLTKKRLILFAFATLAGRDVVQTRSSAAAGQSAAKDSARGIANFSPKFDEGGGLKNRCGSERKSWIRQVLISRTLSVCGEVAERLKAAVC
jgi:hypothetical protein